MLEEAVPRYFGANLTSPYMLLVAPVLPTRRPEIPAVLHIDGTARPQTVSRAEEPLYWDLIREFEKRTGVPALLNTSFNIQEPMVCTPEEAVSTFLRSGVDSLVLEDVWIDNPSRSAT
jgi:carbamoyltransferase